MKKYSWSFNEQETMYQEAGDTIDECLAQAKEQMQDSEVQYDCIYVGESIEYNAYIDTHAIIDNLSESAFEQCGEASEGWLDGVKSEQIDVLNGRLQSVLDAWLKEVDEEPTFYQVDNVQKYNIA